MFADYAAAFNQAVEDYYIRCNQVEAARAPLLSRSSLLAVAPELRQVIDDEIKIGRVRLSADCFAALKTASCDVIEGLSQITDCTVQGGKQLVPQVKPGQECRLQGECIGGFCDLGAVKRPCGTGVCTPYLTTGTACGTGKGQCDPAQSSCVGGVCRARATSGACQSDADCAVTSACKLVAGQGTCVAREVGLLTGAACNAGQLPSGCKSGDRCLLQPDGTSYACTATKGRGSTCQSTSECSGSLVCVFPAAGQPGVCRDKGKTGDACKDAGSICQLTLVCGSGGTCQGAAEPGQACDAAQGGQACLSGQCKADTAGGAATCHDPLSIGGTCQSGSDCQSGVCDRTNHCVSVCAPLS